MRDNTSRWAPLSLLWLVLAAVLGVAGCDDDDKGGDVVEPQRAREVAESGPIEKLSAPDDVVIFAGADSLHALTTNLSKLAGPVGATLQPAVLSQKIAGELALKDPTVIALDKPARLLVVDPKKHPDGAVLVFATTGRDKLLQALPNKQDDVDGNAHAFTGSKLTYLNFLDDYAVLTSDKGLFASHKAFLVKLAGAKLGHEATVVLSAKNAATLYKAELDRAVADMEKEVQAAPGMPGGAGMGKMMQWVAGVAHDLDQLAVHLDTLEDGAALVIDITAKKESALDKTFRALGERKLSLLEKVPTEAPLVVGMSVDPDAEDDLTRSLTAWSLQISMGEQVDPKFSEAMTAYWKATTGEVAFAGYEHPGREGLTLVAVGGIRDADKAREAQTTLRTMMDTPELAKTYESMGLTLSYKNDAYKVGDVPVSTVTAELKDAQTPTAMGDGASLFSNLMSSHVAIAADKSVVVYGKDVKPVIEGWLEGSVPGGFDKSPGLVRAQKKAAHGLFFVAYAVPLDLIKGFGLVQLPQLPSAQSGPGIALSAGAKDGVVQVVLDVPASQAMALSSAMMMMGARGGGL